MAVDPISLMNADAVSDAAWGGAGGVVKALTLRERFGTLIVSVIVGAITSSKFGPVFDPVMDALVNGTIGSLIRWLWQDSVVAPKVTPAHLGPFTVGILALSLVAFIVDFFKGLMKRVRGSTMEPPKP